MEGQTLSEKSEKMIEAILESYKEYPVTVRMDTENIVNKNVLIQVLEELRRILFPGFFDTNRVRSEFSGRPHGICPVPSPQADCTRIRK